MKQRNTKKRLEIPKVIELADGSKRVATTSDLVEAAKNPAAALADPVVTEENNGKFVPVNDREVVEDDGTIVAEFDEIPPQSEAELTAEALIQSAKNVEQEEEPQKFEKLGEFLDNKDPPEVVISEASFNWIKDLPLRLAAGADSLSKWVADTCRQTWLRSIALWNDGLDYAMKLGNQYWAWYDKSPLKSKVDAVKASWLAFMAERAELAAAAVDDDTKPLRKGFFRVMIESMNTRLENLHKEQEEDRKATKKHLKKLEDSVSRLTKIVNRTGPVSGNDLIEFGKAVSQGRKTGAINLFHKMTGASLTDSKAAIDGMLPA